MIVAQFGVVTGIANSNPPLCTVTCKSIRDRSQICHNPLLEIVLKWSHSATDFRNGSDCVPQLILVVGAEVASALPFRRPCHGPEWIPKPYHGTFPERVS